MIEDRLLHENLDENGVPYEADCEFIPLIGKRKSVRINRKCIEFTTHKDEGGALKKIFHIESLKGITFKFQLKTIESTTKLGEKRTRLVFVSLSDTPFRINGVYVLNAYLEYGDILEFYGNKLIFHRPLKENLAYRRYSEDTKTNILIEGETGTGKSRLAQLIHEGSELFGNFVHINISSFPKTLLESELFGHKRGAFTGAISDKKGAIEAAQNGTLFIDEIDSLPLDLQVKLLLFLDSKTIRPVGSLVEKKINCRLIFASGRSLNKLVKDKEMRADFYFRISSGHREKLEPLREDPKIIQDFVHSYLSTSFYTCTRELSDFYQTLLWPGNYRQLKAHLDKKMQSSKGQRKLAYCEMDETLMNIDFSLFQLDSFGESYLTLEDIKKRYVKDIYFSHSKNMLVASKILGISRRTVKKLLEAS